MTSPQEMFDPVNHPKHYNSHPSGVECADITVHMPTMIGSAMKYLWRFDLKGAPVEDLRKAVWCIERHIRMLEEAKQKPEAKPDYFHGIDVYTDNFMLCEECDHPNLCTMRGACSPIDRGHL